MLTFVDRSRWEKYFWAHVQKTDSCWLWTGRIAGRRYHEGIGYGNIYLEGKPRAAHRVAWWLAYGEIPAGKWVLHHCDNPRCVNVTHLFLGTAKENTQDAVGKGRMKLQWVNGESRGEGHPQHKLTHAQVAEIRRRLAEGGTLRGLAREYNVAHGQIGHIKQGRVWRSVC